MVTNVGIAWYLSLRDPYQSLKIAAGFYFISFYLYAVGMPWPRVWVALIVTEWLMQIKRSEGVLIWERERERDPILLCFSYSWLENRERCQRDRWKCVTELQELNQRQGDNIWELSASDGRFFSVRNSHAISNTGRLIQHLFSFPWIFKSIWIESLICFPNCLSTQSLTEFLMSNFSGTLTACLSFLLSDTDT